MSVYSHPDGSPIIHHPPSWRYLQILIEGATEFGFPHVDWLKQHDHIPAKSMDLWRPLPSEGLPRMTKAEFEKLLEEDPKHLFLKIFGRVLDLGDVEQHKTGFGKFLVSMRGKDISHALASAMYFPGLTPEQTRLFLEDSVQFEMKINVKVIAVMTDEKL